MVTLMKNMVTLMKNMKALSSQYNVNSWKKAEGLLIEQIKINTIYEWPLN